MAFSATGMSSNQQIVVRVTPDGRHYTYWIEDYPNGSVIPNTAEQLANQTTSASTLASAIQTDLPTLQS